MLNYFIEIYIKQQILETEIYQKFSVSLYLGFGADQDIQIRRAELFLRGVVQTDEASISTVRVQSLSSKNYHIFIV